MDAPTQQNSIERNRAACFRRRDATFCPESRNDRRSKNIKLKHAATRKKVYPAPSVFHSWGPRQNRQEGPATH